VFAVEAPVDEVVLLWDTAALRGGELLGLVQNSSAALFARRVTVTWGEQESVFALTLQARGGRAVRAGRRGGD